MRCGLGKKGAAGAYGYGGGMYIYMYRNNVIGKL